MGFVEFLILAAITVGIAWAAILVIGLIAPQHPVMVDRIIWGVAILIIVVTLLRALGLTGYDPTIPRVR